MSYIYLGQPYSHDNEDIKHQRFEDGMKAVAYLMQQNLHVFAPIVSCHPIATVYNLPQDYDYWRSYDELMISLSSGVYLLQIDGWNESKGMKAEFKYARELEKPVYLMTPTENEDYQITEVIGDLWMT